MGATWRSARSFTAINEIVIGNRDAALLEGPQYESANGLIPFERCPMDFFLEFWRYFELHRLFGRCLCHALAP